MLNQEQISSLQHLLMEMEKESLPLISKGVEDMKMETTLTDLVELLLLHRSHQE